MKALSRLKLLVASSCLFGFITALGKPSITEVPCRARAWVRAPDLEPGRIVQGDVRVKLDGSCPEVSSYTLGLRFAERSWVKTRREGVEVPEPPSTDYMSAIASSVYGNDSIYETHGFGWMHMSPPNVNQSAWDQYEGYMRDPRLWLVREEERIGFETKHKLSQGVQSTHEVVESFALLVPSTNYPPAFDMPSKFPSRATPDAADTEHVYQYFVDVTFKNGSQLQIPAGFTSFNTIIASELPPSPPETIKVTATRLNQFEEGYFTSTTEDVAPRDQFTLEVTFPNGRHFEQGSVGNITVVSHQLGPGLQRPLGVPLIRPHVIQKRHWAAKHAVDDLTATKLLDASSPYQYQLWPSHDDDFMMHRLPIPDDKWPRFSRRGAIENGIQFTTDAVAAHFQIHHDMYPAFKTYYQTTEIELWFNLQVGNVSSEIESSLDAIGDDDYDWIPTVQAMDNYPIAESLKASVPIFVYRKAEKSRIGEVRQVAHYLSSEARAPIFVDPSRVPELLQKSEKDRNELAPMAQARFFSVEDGNVVKHRYYEMAYGLRKGIPSVHYAGNTWLRKVRGKVERGGAAGENKPW